MNSIKFIILISLIITVACTDRRKHTKNRMERIKARSVGEENREILNILENMCEKCKHSHIEECNDQDFVERCREFEQLKSFEDIVLFLVKISLYFILFFKKICYQDLNLKHHTK
jgi:hypothetical protein